MRMQARDLAAMIVAAAASLSLGPMAALASMTAAVGDLTFGTIAYTHEQQVRIGTLTLTATDTGLGGLGMTNTGWNVTLLSSDFAYVGPNSGTPIPAGNLAVSAAGQPTAVSGQPISATGGPRTTGASGSLNVARKTLQADGPSGVVVMTYYGIGTYSQPIDVSLVVPGQTRAGTYTATLTVTISAGP